MTEGQVSFKVGRVKDDEVFKIKVPTARAIVAGCRRIEDPKIITARMGGRGSILKKLPRPPHLEKFHLEPDERELLELVDGKRTLYELCENGPASAGANARVLYAFSELQMLTVDPSSSGKILIQVVALLYGFRLGHRVIIVGQVGEPLVSLAAQKAIKALKAAAERPAVVRTGSRDLVGGREVPLADRVGVVAVLEEHLGSILRQVRIVRSQLLRRQEGRGRLFGTPESE